MRSLFDILNPEKDGPAPDAVEVADPCNRLANDSIGRVMQHQNDGGVFFIMVFGLDHGENADVKFS